MRNLLLLTSVLLLLSCSKRSNNGADEFWNNLSAHCGKSYEGVLTFPEDDPDFGGKKLVMHVASCTNNQIKIPFFVGDDKSRVWVLTRNGKVLELHHDHTNEDGTPDEITLYGGTATNTGQATIQVFPANQHTVDMLPQASTNVWWFTLDHNKFTYNLRRVGSDRLFTVTFDLSKAVETPEKPWGWN